MNNIKKCIECENDTDNYYTIKTNQGKVHKCKECYELSYMRDQRNEYGLAYQDRDLSTQVRRRF